MLTLLVIGVVVKALSAPPPGPVDGPLRPVGGGTQQLTQDPQQQLELYLAQCRQFSAPELNEPNWDKAEASCNKAKDIEPINEEVNALLLKIKKERAAQDHFEKGKKLIQRLREDEALDEFAKIPNDSYYYNQALPIVRDTIEKVKAKFGAQCKDYFSSGHYPEALPSCEHYMKLACQGMKREDLQPPVMKKLKLVGRPRPRRLAPEGRAVPEVPPGARQGRPQGAAVDLPALPGLPRAAQGGRPLRLPGQGLQRPLQGPRAAGRVARVLLQGQRASSPASPCRR